MAFVCCSPSAKLFCWKPKSKWHSGTSLKLSFPQRSKRTTKLSGLLWKVCLFSFISSSILLDHRVFEEDDVISDVETDFAGLMAEGRCCWIEDWGLDFGLANVSRENWTQVFEPHIKLLLIVV